MKKSLKKVPRKAPSLGDLILAVSSVRGNTPATLAAVADLLDSGRSLGHRNGRKPRTNGK